jgi:hypothetical protein
MWSLTKTYNLLIVNLSSVSPSLPWQTASSIAGGSAGALAVAVVVVPGKPSEGAKDFSRFVSTSVERDFLIIKKTSKTMPSRQNFAVSAKGGRRGRFVMFDRALERAGSGRSKTVEKWKIDRN